MTRKTRRVFDKEFKVEAVRLATGGDRTIAEVSKNLGIAETLLSKWVRAARDEGADAFRGQGKRTEHEDEVWRLKRKNRELEQELEFLKKVSRYFAKAPK